MPHIKEINPGTSCIKKQNYPVAQCKPVFHAIASSSFAENSYFCCNIPLEAINDILHLEVVMYMWRFLATGRFGQMPVNINFSFREII